MSETQTYPVLDSLRHNKKKYKQGDTVDLTADEAEPLLAIGVIGPLDSPADGEGGDKNEGGNNPPEDEGEKLKAIQDAIGALDKENEELWTNGGKPQVAAIEAVTGWTVSAKERDAVWAGMQSAAE